MFAISLLLLCFALKAASQPMGWNSYDSTGGAVDEATLVAVADYMVESGLASAGYTTLIIDEGWSERNGVQLVDVYGRPLPNELLFPSAAGGAGLRPISDALALRGLSLGLWVVRGVPRVAVTQNLPIWNASPPATASAAFRLDRDCSWKPLTHGSNAPSLAALQYYQSMAALFRDWGVSTVKGDCFFPNKPPGAPQSYFEEDLLAFSDAMQSANLTLLLSPGISVTLANATQLATDRLARTYRVTEDTWDLWESADDGSFPQGIKRKFAVAANVSVLIGLQGTFPDLDMLPFGDILQASKAQGVVGPARPTRLTPDEQRTTVTLYCFARSPLILGARLPLAESDETTLRLVTNPEILTIQRASAANRPVPPFPPPASPASEPHVWAASSQRCPHGTIGGTACTFLGLFNAGDLPDRVGVRIDDLLQPPAPPAGAKVCGRDLWIRGPAPDVAALPPGAQSFSRAVVPHGAEALLLWLVEPGVACTDGAEAFSAAMAG